MGFKIRPISEEAFKYTTAAIPQTHDELKAVFDSQIRVAKHTLAVVRGAFDGLKGTVEGVAAAIDKPCQNFFCPISRLALDTAVIVAANSPESDTVLTEYVRNDPRIYNEAVQRMEMVVRVPQQAATQFMEASGLERTEMASEMISTLLLPLPFAKGVFKTLDLARNMKHFGTAKEPGLFKNLPRIGEEPKAPVLDFKRLTRDDVRALQGEHSLIYVVEPDRSLLIANPLQSNGLHLKHYELGRGGPVYAGGEVKIVDGMVTQLNGRSGSYRPQGEHLPAFVEKVFTEWGAPEAKGRYKRFKDADLSKKPDIILAQPIPITHRQKLSIAGAIATANVASGDPKDYVISQVGEKLHTTATSWLSLAGSGQNLDHVMEAFKKVYEQEKLDPKTHLAFQHALLKSVPDSQLTNTALKVKLNLLNESKAHVLKIASNENNPALKQGYGEIYRESKTITDTYNRQVEARGTFQTKNEWVEQEDPVALQYLREIGQADHPESVALFHSKTFRETVRQIKKFERNQLRQVEVHQLGYNLGYLANNVQNRGLQNSLLASQAIVHGYQSGLAIESGLLTGSALGIATGVIGLLGAGNAIANIFAEESGDNSGMMIYGVLQQMEMNLMHQIEYCTDLILNQNYILHDQQRRLVLEALEYIVNAIDHVDQHFERSHTTFEKPMMRAVDQVGVSLQHLLALGVKSDLRLILDKFADVRGLAANYYNKVIKKQISEDTYNDLISKLGAWASEKSNDPLLNGSIYLPQDTNSLNQLEHKRIVVGVLQAFKNNPEYIIGVLGSFYYDVTKRNPSLGEQLSNPQILNKAVIDYIRVNQLREDLEFDSEGHISREIRKNLETTAQFEHELRTNSKFFTDRGKVIETLIQTIKGDVIKVTQNDIESRAKQSMDKLESKPAKTEISYEKGVWANPELTVGDIHKILSDHKIPLPAELALAEGLGWDFKWTYQVINREKSDLFKGDASIIHDVYDVGHIAYSRDRWTAHFKQEKWDRKLTQLQERGLTAKLIFSFEATKDSNIQNCPLSSFKGSFAADVRVIPQAPDVESTTCLYNEGFGNPWSEGMGQKNKALKVWNEKSPLTYQYLNLSAPVDFNQNVTALATWAKEVKTDQAYSDLATQYTRYGSDVETSLVELDYLSNMLQACSKLAGLSLPKLPDREQIVLKLQQRETIEFVNQFKPVNVSRPIHLDSAQNLLDSFLNKRVIQAKLEKIAEIKEEMQDKSVDEAEEALFKFLEEPIEKPQGISMPALPAAYPTPLALPPADTTKQWNISMPQDLSGQIALAGVVYQTVSSWFNTTTQLVDYPKKEISLSKMTKALGQLRLEKTPEISFAFEGVDASLQGLIKAANQGQPVSRKQLREVEKDIRHIKKEIIEGKRQQDLASLGSRIDTLRIACEEIGKEPSFDIRCFSAAIAQCERRFTKLQGVKELSGEVQRLEDEINRFITSFYIEGQPITSDLLYVNPVTYSLTARPFSL